MAKATSATYVVHPFNEAERREAETKAQHLGFINAHYGTRFKTIEKYKEWQKQQKPSYLRNPDWD